MLSGMAEEVGDRCGGLHGNSDPIVAVCGYLRGVAGGGSQGVWLALGERWA